VVLGLVTVWFQHTRAIAGEYIPIGGPASRVAGAGLEIGFYFLKCVLPVELMTIYPRLNLEPLSAVRFLPWVAVAAAAGWLWSRRASSWARGAAFALGSFAVNLVPVLGFIPMSYLRLSQVADHFAYLPLVSMAGLAAAGLGIWRRSPRDGGSPLRTRLPIVCAAAACAALALESHRYAATFRSEAASVTYTLRHNPDSWFAHFRMGNILRTEGWTDEAMREYREALRIFPGSLEARSNLGNLLFKAKGRAEEAMVEYEEAIRIFPQSAEARCNLGNLLFAGGRTQAALAQFQEAVRLLPNYAAGQNGLAMALGAAGDLQGAAVHAELALRLDPDFPEARNNLANMLLQMGRTDEAIAQYREALRLKPDFPEACNNLGVALSTVGRLTEAIAEFERAMKLRPDYADARRNLADTLAREGKGASP
jgi:tetratricopeptide (TPR) repeat protein